MFGSAILVKERCDRSMVFLIRQRKIFWVNFCAKCAHGCLLLLLAVGNTSGELAGSAETENMVGCLRSPTEQLESIRWPLRAVLALIHVNT